MTLLFGLGQLGCRFWLSGTAGGENGSIEVLRHVNASATTCLAQLLAPELRQTDFSLFASVLGTYKDVANFIKTAEMPGTSRLIR